MKIATLLFTYNRSYHTKRTLDALSRNVVLPEKLYIFQDGPKDGLDRREWDRVNALVRTVDWCDCETIVSDRNKGLAKSIVSGINFALERYDAVIVLEDDCVTHLDFMAFMTGGLQKYRTEREVYSVSGYAYPVKVERNGTDAYFTGRISSWGWGTWKDRWVHYETDYRILGRIKGNPALERRMHVWGQDLESYLIGNVYGHCDSWAVFWALAVIEGNGCCLSPYESLLENIGFDGTGVHCEEENFEQWLAVGRRDRFQYPEKVGIDGGCEKAFRDYFSWTSGEARLKYYNELLAVWVSGLMEGGKGPGDLLLEMGIRRCSIWGKGRLCDLLLKDLEGRIQVLAVVESHPAGEQYGGFPVVDVRRLPEGTQAIVVIPAYDIRKIRAAARKETDCVIIPLDELLKGRHGAGKGKE